MSQIDIDCEKCGDRYARVEDGWCKPCQIDNFKKNLTNWTSGNEIIDDLIQEKNQEIREPNDIIFEWIPYNQLNDIKEINNVLYSAIWKDGPLYYCHHKKDYVRKSENEKVIIFSCLYDLPIITKEFYDKVKSYFDLYDFPIYGISQNPNTKEYFMVFQVDHCEKCGNKYTNVKYKWCELCQINYLKKNFTNWTSGNEIVDNFIQEFQLKINDYDDIIIEWIPYDQFDNIKKIRKDGFVTIYSTIWKDGPLYYCLYKKEYQRKLGKKQVALKYMHNSQNITNELLIRVRNSNVLPIYGISQNPDTKDYIVVIQDEYCEKCGEEYTDLMPELGPEWGRKWCKPCQMDYLKKNFINWTSGDKKIDKFIQDRQVNHIDHHYDPILEWISYDQFDNVKELGENGIITICTAIWKVTLKCYNTQDITEFFNEDNEYSMLYRIDNLYGLSQNPDTKDYIMFLEDEYCENCGKQCTHIVEKWCEPCEISYLKKNFTNWTSGNEKINNFIQEFQLRINNDTDIIVEWIPYNQFDNIKEIGKDDLFTIYSAIWKNGQLNYDKNKRIYKRNLKNQNEIVTLKSFNSQNITEEFFNEGNKYSIYSHQDDKIYGVSQNPNTKNYIIVIQERYCENCGNEYTDTFHKWCKSCQISNLKNNFTNWTSKNEKIDKFIQEMQLKIDCYDDTIVEWIPYEQFNNIKKINKDDFVTICSAIWKNGQLNYDEYKKIYQRNLKNNNRKIILKFHKLQDHNTDEFFNEANEYSIKIYGDNNRDNKIYGITQNPDTNEYIMVIENKYCEKCSENLHYYTWCKTCQLDNLKNNFINWTSGNKKIDELIQEMQLKINDRSDTIFEWIPFNQFNKIEIIGKGGFAIVYSAIWKDGPLFYKEKFRRTSGNRKVALKCLHNSSQNITDEFINEIRAYSLNYNENIIRIYGLSQNPDTKDYIIVLGYASGGSFYYQINKNYDEFDWMSKLQSILNIIKGLKNIHQKQMVHRDFHVGNILVEKEILYLSSKIYISDMGLCGEVSNIKNESKIYGVIPYVAPEVLKGKPYTQAADIYSLGMIMYFVATGKQPFSNCAHDEFLVLNICNGIRPEMNESEIPKCYIDIMKKCWDSDPNNRPSVTELEIMIKSFFSFGYFKDKEIEKQFNKAEEYRKANLLSIRSNQSSTHLEAYYTSRLLNPLTKNLYSMEVIDFTKL
ncbi:unnamed protein product [Rhizophagus irregularis]|nr:unnamed protein product [Rhizophagus irregularis]